MNNLTAYHFRELITKSYSLDYIFLMKLINDGKDVTELSKTSMKIENMLQTMFRKDLITEDWSEVTIVGKELLQFIDTKSPEKIIKKRSIDTDFERWWNAYPGTDTFTYKDRTFQGSRSLRVNKDKCHSAFDKILLEGKYSVDDLVNALEYDVLQKAENSYRLGQNKLTYMQNSLTYLNQRSFEPFIELIRTEASKPTTPKKYNGTDI